MKCLECKKDLVQTAGKRAKQFCNSTCRSNYWQKAKRRVEANNKPKKKAEVEEQRNPKTETRKLHSNPMTFEEMMAAAEEMVKPKNK